MENIWQYDEQEEIGRNVNKLEGSAYNDSSCPKIERKLSKQFAINWQSEIALSGVAAAK